MDVRALIERLAIAAQPKGNNLFVLPLVKASRSFLVDAGENRELPEPGIVVSVGPGKVGSETGRTIPVTSVVGELVWFGKYSGIGLDMLTGDGKPIQLLIVPDDLGQAGQPEGSYELEMHDDDPRKIHLKGWTCDACPKIGESGLRALQEAAGAGPLISSPSPWGDVSATSEPRDDNGRLIVVDH